VNHKEYLDESAPKNKLFSLDRELIGQIYNIDKKIQNFYDTQYDYKNLKIEYGMPVLERKKTNTFKKKQTKRDFNEREMHGVNMKKLEREIKNIKRDLSRIEKELKHKRCTSSNLLTL
jgi:hypothetical protein